MPQLGSRPSQEAAGTPQYRVAVHLHGSPFSFHVLWDANVQIHRNNMSDSVIIISA